MTVRSSVRHVRERVLDDRPGLLRCIGRFWARRRRRAGHDRARQRGPLEPLRLRVLGGRPAGHGHELRPATRRHAAGRWSDCARWCAATPPASPSPGHMTRRGPTARGTCPGPPLRPRLDPMSVDRPPRRPRCRVGRRGSRGRRTSHPRPHGPGWRHPDEPNDPRSSVRRASLAGFAHGSPRCSGRRSNALESTTSVSVVNTCGVAASRTRTSSRWRVSRARILSR